MNGAALKCVECDTPLLFLAMTKLCPLGDATVCPLAAKPECAHENVHEATTGPINRAGNCRVYAVCEDCDEELAQVGWDSVL